MTPQIQDYTPDYREMIEGWHKDHGSFAPPAAILPKLGIIVTLDAVPSAAMWLYMDNSVGVCFPEHVVAKPRLGLRASRKALFAGLEFLMMTAKAMDYGIVWFNTLPTIAESLRKRYGFIPGRRNMVQVVGTTGGHEHGN